MKFSVLIITLSGLVEGGLISRLLGRNKVKVPICECKLKYINIPRAAGNACDCVGENSPAYSAIYNNYQVPNNSFNNMGQVDITQINRMGVAQQSPDLQMNYAPVPQNSNWMERLRESSRSKKTESRIKVTYKVSVKEKVKTSSKEKTRDGIVFPCLGC
jgi:hypothetical protein